MRTLLTAILAASLFSVSFAASAQDAYADVAAVAPTGFHLDGHGDLVHDASGARFPQRFAGFVRTGEASGDPSGEAVMIEYRFPSEAEVIGARIAIVHIEQMSAADHYAIMRPMARAYFSDIHPLSEGPVNIPGAPNGSVWRGSFQGTRDKVPYEFNLTTVDLGYWSARVATAYPRSGRSEAILRLNALIGELRRLSLMEPAPAR